jgi:hypothetical protein
MFATLPGFLLNLLSALALVCIGMAAFGVGHPLHRRLRRAGNDDLLATVVWSIALGLVALASLWTALGLVGLLYRGIVVGLSLLAACWGLGEIVQLYFACRLKRHAQPPSPDEPADSPSKWLARLIACAAILVGLAALVGALAPPTAGDALCYHLELPKVFLQRHAIIHLPYSDNATFPLLGEMLYLWGLAVEGPVAAQLVAWAAGLLLALAAVLLATPLLGRPWAWTVGAIVLLVPGIQAQMTAPLCDALVALWLTLGISACGEADRAERSTPWLLVAGAMFGGALATKYVALPLVFVFVTARWARRVRRRDWKRRSLAPVALAALIAAVIAAPWYLRAAWHRGDPVFPFGGIAFSNDNRPIRSGDKTPLSPTLLHLLAAPWKITMNPVAFGGRSHQLGPVFLMVLPGLVFARRLRGLDSYLGIALAYALVWFLLRQNARFLFPIIPLLAVGVTWGVIESRRMPRSPQIVAYAALVLVLASHAAIGLYRARDKLAVAAGWESRHEYLARVEPSFAAATIINRLAGAKARVLSQDYRGFYFDGQFVRESVYRRVTGYDRLLPNPTGLSGHLKQRGFTHLVLKEPLAAGVPHDRTLLDRVESELSAYDNPAFGSLLPIANYLVTDADGLSCRYRVVLIR